MFSILRKIPTNLLLNALSQLKFPRKFSGVAKVQRVSAVLNEKSLPQLKNDIYCGKFDCVLFKMSPSELFHIQLSKLTSAKPNFRL